MELAQESSSPQGGVKLRGNSPPKLLLVKSKVYSKTCLIKHICPNTHLGLGIEHFAEMDGLVVVLCFFRIKKSE